MLLHIIDSEIWEIARNLVEYRPDSLEKEGFIHLSTPQQVLFPANVFYRGKKNLLLLVVDPTKLLSPLRFDKVDGHGTFPHLYGSLNIDAVTTVIPFPSLPDGTFILPEVLKDAG